METPKHYFLICPIYANIRQKMVDVINGLTNCNINTILFGDSNLTLDENKIIFKSVHEFIKMSKRFDV